MTEIISGILNSLAWEDCLVLKKKHGSSPEITAFNFIKAVLIAESIPEAANILNVGQQTLNRIISKYLIPIFGSRTGGNDTWKLALANNAKYKLCRICNSYKKHEFFSKDTSNFDKLDVKCKNCKSLINANFYSKNKDTYYKEYLEINRSDYIARNAKRRAAKLQATPQWADLEKIKDIYKNCPEGYHVDHIYPLTSNWVCGLHVPENLQYLTAEDNLRKGNRPSAPVVK